MKIVPIDAAGEPVDVLSISGGKDKWDLTVSCYGKPHRLTLKLDKELMIQDHSREEVSAEETMATLGDRAGSACPCVRIKIWLPNGIYMMEVLP